MIDENKIKSIQDKIKKAIEVIEKEEKVKITFGGCSYNKAYYTTSMKVMVTGRSKEIDSVYLSLCKKLGFTQNIIGMEFDGISGRYLIIDIKTRNRKYPVIAQCLTNGKQYKYSVSDIKRRMGGDQIINRNANIEKLLK